MFNIFRKYIIFFALLILPVVLFGVLGNPDNTELALLMALSYFLCFLLLIRGTWRFLFQPPDLYSWRFRGNKPPTLTFYSISQYETNSSVELRMHWLKDKQEYSSSERRIKKWQKEIDNMSKRYNTKYALQKAQRTQSTLDSVRKTTTERIKYGERAPKIICPHCQEKGKVWRKNDATIFEEGREKGIVGATIGRKTVNQKKVTKLYCKNCETSWTV
tara:strand:+ start:579 stop:1229 length:651 start_codon:yes stop_codon:yes gene_type:complete